MDSTDSAVIRWFEWFEEKGMHPYLDKKKICMVLGNEEVSWYGIMRDTQKENFRNAVLEEEYEREEMSCNK